MIYQKSNFSLVQSFIIETVMHVQLLYDYSLLQ